MSTAGRASPGVPVTHHRSSPFSYVCHACRRCCHNKRIQLNPYELVRLSRHLGCSTTEVIARFTVDGGTALAARDDGACVFLTADGCGVHAARPLACRLYPLGRFVTSDDREIFLEHAPHPQSAGVYGTSGTIGDFLAAQGAGPWLEGADRYYMALQRARGERRVTPSTLSSRLSADDYASARWAIDADLAVSAARGRSIALDAAELVEAHLEVLQRELTGDLEGRRFP